MPLPFRPLRPFAATGTTQPPPPPPQPPPSPPPPPAPPPPTVTTTGLDFRATQAFVTDPAGYTFDDGSDFQPPALPFDRSRTVDPRLAGVVAVLNKSAPSMLSVTVTPGTYELRLALGDMGSVQRHFAVLYDGTAQVAVIADDLATQPGYFFDAVQGQTETPQWMSAADWPAKNEPYTFTTQTGTVRLRLGSTGDALGSTTLSTISLTGASA